MPRVQLAGIQGEMPGSLADHCPRLIIASPVIRGGHQARTWNFDLKVPRVIERLHLVAVDSLDRTVQVDWVEAGFQE